MSKLTDLDIVTARQLLDKREICAVELISSHIDKAKEVQEKHNMFITTTYDTALKQAEDADKRIANGTTRSLEGIPVGIKDLFCSKGIKTTAGSKMLHNFIPGYSATVFEKLSAAGAISLGKLNMDEFAMGSANITSYYGPVVNPWKSKNSDEDLTPGGSSGGSSASVAINSVMAALGSDTGGSVRQPASFTGTVGVKPTYGRCSRWGMIAFASSLDQAGVLTSTVRDSALVLQEIMGYDPNDATCAKMDVPNLSEIHLAGVKGKKIGIIKELLEDEQISTEILQMWQQGQQWLVDQGAEIVEVSIPDIKYSLPIYYIIAPAEASSNLSRYDGVKYGYRSNNYNNLEELYVNSRSEGFGTEVKRRIMMGTYVLSHSHYEEFFCKAQRVRAMLKREFDHIMAGVDALLLPSTPNDAFAINAKMTPIEMYLNDFFTVPASMVGLPAISVPASLSKNNLPLGLQIVGRRYDEKTMFEVAYTVEKCANFPKRGN